jgi:hypothetical protein
MQSRSYKHPDEVRKITNRKIELAIVGDSISVRMTLKPEGRWSKDVKLTVNTNVVK